MSDTQTLNSEIQRLKGSIKRWNNANMVFVAIAAVSAAGLVLTGLGLNRKNDDLGILQDNLSGLMKQEIADTNRLAGEANKQAGEANDRAAQANRIAEQEKLARIKLEERFAWRRIGPKEHASIVAALKPHAGATVEIMKLGEVEAFTYADDIIKTLQDSGWLITLNFSGSISPPQYGLQCSMDESLPAGKAIADAFKSLPTAQIRSVSGSPPVARILVGLRPPP